MQRFFDEGLPQWTGPRLRRCCRFSSDIGACVLHAKRNANGEATTLPRVTCHVNAPVVQADEVVDQCESDAAALVGAAMRPLDPMKTFEYVRQFMLWNTGAGIDDAQFRCTIHRAQMDLDASRESEFEGIGKQVQDYFFPHVAVDLDLLRQRRAVHNKHQACPVAYRFEIARKFRCVGGKIGRLPDWTRATCLDPGKIQQGIDQLEKPQSVAMRNFQQFLAIWRRKRDMPFQQVLDGTQHQGKRRAEFMRHVGEEFRLRMIQFSQPLVELHQFGLAAFQLLHGCLELAIGFFHFRRPMQYFGLHPLCPLLHILDARSAFARQDEVGNIFHVVDDIKQTAIRTEDRCIDGAPVAHLEVFLGASSTGNIVFLDTHGVGHAIAHHPLQ